MPPQARREPEPVESIAASFGAWFPPPVDRSVAEVPVGGSPAAAVSTPGGQTPSAPARTLAPLAGAVEDAPRLRAARSPTAVTDRRPGPGQSIRTLSVLRPPAGDIPPTDGQANEARATPTPPDRITATRPEAQVHAVRGHSATTTVQGARGDGEIRSPVAAALLTLLAVLVVVVIVLGFLYMFTSFL